MELNFTGLFAGVGINILDFDNLGNILDDFNNSVKFIDLHHVNNLLTEKLSESGIHFVIKLWIFSEQLFVVAGQ